MAIVFKVLKPRLPVFHPLVHSHFAGLLLGFPALRLFEEAAPSDQP